MAAPTVLDTADWSPDVETMFEAAFARVKGEQATGYSLKAGRRALALMLNQWSVKRINFWKLVRYPVTLVPGEATALLPADTVTIIGATVTEGTVDRAVEIVTIDRYEENGAKRMTGVPQEVLVTRGRTAVTLTFFPVPAESYPLFVQRLVRFKDVGRYDGGLDMPVEFFNAAVCGLAWYLSQEAEFGCNAERRAELLADYERALAEAQEADNNRGNVTIRTDLSCYSRI